MGKRRKVAAILGAGVLICTLLSPLIASTVASAKPDPAPAAIAWATSPTNLGQPVDDGDCLAFVASAYAAAGVSIGGVGNKNGAAQYWQIDPKGYVEHPGDTNPPVGALVFWAATPSGPITYVNPYGHVGIYLGDNTVVSTSAYPEQPSSNPDVFEFPLTGPGSRNADGYPYLGWLAPPGVGVIPPPTVNNFAASPSTLSAAGGQVTLSADVTNAASCVFSSKSTIAGLPVTVSCSAADKVITLPANAGKKSVKYQFTLTVKGSKTVTAKAVVSEGSGLVVSINPNIPWTTTGINLREGESVQISASGKIYFSGGSANPQGPNGAGVPQSTCVGPNPVHGPFVAPALSCWSLIGKISGGQPFEVGSNIAFAASATGELFLGVNDNDFSDNAGGWIAVVATHK